MFVSDSCLFAVQVLPLDHAAQPLHVEGHVDVLGELSLHLLAHAGAVCVKS